ncbi:hypothetical protein FW907_08640, partial [Campylobacter jejuni]|nr:hypothetical protein [Campylobacter jejuni]
DSVANNQFAINQKDFILVRNEMKKYFNIFKIFTNKTNAKFGLGVCSVVLSSSVCFAAVQATSKDGKIFYISEHS